jgi:predicted 3-demethylubiquinone-9 3-methyltransferase (glyoxalase superfamily)
MQKIIPFLWFNGKLEEAITLYTSIFKDAKILKSTRVPQGMPGAGEKLFTATFQLAGQQFMGMDWAGGAAFNESISLFVTCQTQEEVDHYWDALTADGGKEIQCGWLVDKFGVSWQICPAILPELMSSTQPGVAQRVSQAMMKMVKLDIAGLEAAAETGS